MYKSTDVYNGQRYCIIKTPEDINSIPREIPLLDPKTKKVLMARISFYGQTYHCKRCFEWHAGECPEMKEFYEAKAAKELMRRKKQINTKVIADSTLRNVDPLGLKAEVMCIPGAGIGHVAQALHDDPDCEEVSNIIMAAGTNDVFFDKVDNEKFAYGVDKGFEKVEQLAENHPDKCIQVLTPMLDPDTLEMDQRIRIAYIEKMAAKVAYKMDNVTHLDRTKLPNYDNDDEPNNTCVEMEDMRHPSPDGTKHLVKMMNDLDGGPLVWNENFIINERRYRRIQTIPRYGCKACHVFNEQPIGESGFCALCDDSYSKRPRPNVLLAEVTQRLQEEAKKRKRTDDGNDDEEYAKKPFSALKTPESNRSYVEIVNSNGKN